MGQGKSREIRSKIRSIKNNEKITKAMKLVSASKLRKSTYELDRLKPYMQGLKKLLAQTGVVSSPGEGESSSSGKVAIVVFAGERALCGSFNTNAVKSACAMGEKFAAEGYRVEYIAIGKKAHEGLKYRGIQVLRTFNLKETLPTVDFSLSIAAYLQSLVDEEGFSRIELSYTEFRSAMSRLNTSLQYLPFDGSQFVGTDEEETSESGHYLFEPDKGAVIKELRKQLLQGLLHQCYIESLASEYGARMVAMDNAARNCKELTNKLTLKLNRERQAAITQEIAEIVGGAAALQ